MSSPDQTETTATGGGPALGRAWRWVVGIGGVLLAAAAAAEVVGDDGDGPVTALLVVGAVLATLPLVVDRLLGVSFGVDGLRFDLSQQIAGLGAADTAKRVDAWGGGLAEAADAYASAHTVLRGPDMAAARTRLQDHFVQTAEASALVQQYDAREVRKLFRNGPPVVRVLVLGLMLGDPSLADADTIESAITQSRTANEQYQGLRLAERVGRRLPAADRQRLRTAIERDPIPDGPNRSALRAAVLVLLADEPLGTGASDDPGDSPGDAPSARGRASGGAAMPAARAGAAPDPTAR